MNIIEDATSYVHTYILLTKSSVIKSLKKWVLIAEQKIGKSVGMFNINNAKLKSIKFVEFCASRGI